jgi:hypothetical protein
VDWFIAWGKEQMEDAHALRRGMVVTMHKLQARADLNGTKAKVLLYVKERRRWQVQVLGDGQQTLSLKLACLIVNVPVCTVLWRSAKPPRTQKKRLRALTSIVAECSLPGSVPVEKEQQEFVDGGGVSALVEVAFAAWPTDGFVSSTYWADEVVEWAPGVFHSARRVALSGLAEMAAEGK